MAWPEVARVFSHPGPPSAEKAEATFNRTLSVFLSLPLVVSGISTFPELVCKHTEVEGCSAQGGGAPDTHLTGLVPTASVGKVHPAFPSVAFLHEFEGKVCKIK